MRALVLLAVLPLAACVGGAGPAPVAGTAITVDGTVLTARQEQDWPSMIAPISAETGKTVIVQSGTAPTVIISGSAGDRALAIRALAQFCGRDDFGPEGFDTQYVYQDPKTGDWWFDGFCG